MSKKREAEAADWPHADKFSRAVAFISATLGEEWDSADGTSLYWTSNGVHLVALRVQPALGIDVLFSEAGNAQDLVHKLYAIVGWAHYHGVPVRFD